MDRPIERLNFGAGSDFVKWAFQLFQSGAGDRGISDAARGFFFDHYRDSGEGIAKRPRYARKVAAEIEKKMTSFGSLAAMAATNHGSEVVELEHLKRGYASMLLLFAPSPFCPQLFAIDSVVRRITANCEQEAAA